jgi:hypothetical protein
VRAAERWEAWEDEDAATRELAVWRHEIRLHALIGLARRPAKPPRILRIGVLALLLLIHVALLIGSRAPRHGTVIAETAVIVRFLPADLPEPTLPMPTPAPRASADAPRAVGRAAVARAVAATASATPAPAAIDTVAPLQLFNRDGSIRLPVEPVPFASPKLQLSAELMQRGHNLQHCRQTRFASGYARDESVGDEIARKYLVWIGLYNADFVERKAGQRQADAAAACDG